MKIVHICLGSFFIDNYSYQENILPKYHKKIGHDVTVIASQLSFNSKGQVCYLPNESQSYTSNGIKIIRAKYKPFIKPVNILLRRYVNLIGLLEQEAPDFIFIHGCQFMDIVHIRKYVKTHSNIKIVADFHSDFSNSGTNWISKYLLHKLIWKNAYKIIEKNLSAIYCITPWVEKFIIEFYSAVTDKIELLPLCADDDEILKINFKEIRNEIRKKLGISNEDIVIIHGGKIDPNKKTIELIKAVLNMPENIHLIIFGTIEEKYENEIKALIKNNSRIHLIGWIISENCYSYFAASDIACFPGGQSVLWQQAIATGLPLVCKYWYGVEYLDVGGNILFLPESSPSLIYNTLNLLIKNPELMERMAGVAKTKGRAYFSYHRIAQKVINDVFK